MYSNMELSRKKQADQICTTNLKPDHGKYIFTKRHQAI